MHAFELPSNLPDTPATPYASPTLAELGVPLTPLGVFYPPESSAPVEAPVAVTPTRPTIPEVVHYELDSNPDPVPDTAAVPTEPEPAIEPGPDRLPATREEPRAADGIDEAAIDEPEPAVAPDQQGLEPVPDEPTPPAEPTDGNTEAEATSSSAIEARLLELDKQIVKAVISAPRREMATGLPAEAAATQEDMDMAESHAQELAARPDTDEPIPYREVPDEPWDVYIDIDEAELYRDILTMAYQRVHGESESPKAQEAINDYYDHEMAHVERALEEPGLQVRIGVTFFLVRFNGIGRYYLALKPGIKIAGQATKQQILRILSAPEHPSSTDGIVGGQR